MRRAGEIVMWAGDELPRYALWCDGATYNIGEYPQLYAVIKHLYGSASPTTFRVPDLRGRVVVGAGQGSNLTERDINDAGGREMVQLSAAELPAHQHGFVAGADVGNTQGGSGGGTGGFANASGATSTAGGNQPHENMPPYRALNFIIYTI